MDQTSRNDIAAAAAAHRELGRDYDDAVAESLVDRIGAEIDKRVDERLSARSSGPRPRSLQPGTSQALLVTGAAAVAAVTGLVATLANRGQNPATITAIITIWLILAVIGLGTVLRENYRSRER